MTKNKEIIKIHKTFEQGKLLTKRLLEFNNNMNQFERSQRLGVLEQARDIVLKVENTFSGTE